MMDPRYAVHDTSELLSPSLLIYPQLVRRNIEEMIALAGDPARLRPHVKTHKMAEIVRLAESLGIRKHKCATIAEAEMAAAAGATDVLLAYPLTGPNLKRFVHLVRGYRTTTFRATVDHPDSARRSVGRRAGSRRRRFRCSSTWTSAWAAPASQPGDAAAELYALVDALPNLVVDGLHAYDGHIHDTDLTKRAADAAAGGFGEHAGLARPAAETGTARSPVRGWWNAHVSDSCQARSSRRRVFARDAGALRQQLSHALSRPAIHSGRLAADAGGQPSGPRAGFASTWVTRRSPPTPPGPRARLLDLDDARPGRPQRGAHGHRDGTGREHCRSARHFWRFPRMSAPRSPCTAGPT